MNFKQLKDFDFKNIDIDRNQFERITVGVIILCALSLFLVTIKTQHSIKIDGTKIAYKGQMQNHRLNGQGTLTYDNGDTYIDYQDASTVLEFDYGVAHNIVAPVSILTTLLNEVVGN